VAANIAVFLYAQTNVLPLLAEVVRFNRAFAPQAGLVSRYEQPAREKICLNGTWCLQEDENTDISI
jgi:hypothetical protein